MRRREFITLLSCAATTWPFSADAQEAGKIRRIGFLRLGPPHKGYIDGLRQGLRELGYIEGQTIAIEFGLAASINQLPDVAAELVRQKVEVIVASGVPSVLPARDATSTIPVVFVAALDPVATGLATSLAQPGGNVTGITSQSEDIFSKRMQLLKELLPDLVNIAVLVRATSPVTARYRENAELAAMAMAVNVQILSVSDPSELEAVFGAARGADALHVVADTMFTIELARIAELALQSRLPTIHGAPEFPEAGGLMSYGARTADLHRRAATHVHKILQGTKPADLPIEQPTKFDLVINLKTAKALGLTFPSSMLRRADEVIE